MAYPVAGEGEKKSWWAQSGRTTILLIVFFVLALFIRSYFNFDASYNEGDYRWSGTDGYYHMRVVDYIRETGEFLVFDDLINYPIGANNPRPPLFDWTIAAVGGLLAPLFGDDAALSTGHAAAFSPAVWAALTVFPMYFLGKEAFSRRAGLWASFLTAVMAAHITRSNLGALDHDATILFFFTLGAAFFVKALKLLKPGVYVADYRRTGDIGPGFARVFRENQASIAYAGLTGVAFAGIGLTWQGYTYAYGVFAVWYGFQLLLNHMRQRDSTPHLVLGLIPFIVGLLLVWPYYDAVGRVHLQVYPTLYILIGVVLASLVFVPTRHLPPILVLPLTAGVAALGLVIMLFVLPAIGDLFFSGLGYFVQSKLYSTIAEAQRTPLGYLVFSVGVIPFFFGLAGLVMAAVSALRRRRDDHLFVFVWAAVALLMAFTATRFVFNASVGFALMAGWATDRFLAKVRFGDVKKTWRSVRSAGYNVFKSTKSSVRTRHVFAALFLVLLLLLPSVWSGVDAGMPGEYLNKVVVDADDRDTAEFLTQYFGAFGQDFLGSDWMTTLDWLADQDQDLAPGDRPAFIAWWDYGFYAAQRGLHPTVADPFQFGYQISGRILASQSEEEAILFMTLRILEANLVRGEVSGSFDSGVVAVLDVVRGGLADDLVSSLHAPPDYDEAYDVLAAAVTTPPAIAPDEGRVVKLYRDIRTTTGDSIRYLTLDGRMFPCDDPGTLGIDSPSIFYAPVFLADKNPEDFVRTTYQDVFGQTYWQKIYDTKDGHSVAVDRPHLVDSQGRRYLLGGASIFPMGKNGYIDYSDPRSSGEGIRLNPNSEALEYEDAFYETLLYRAWVGPEPASRTQKLPGQDDYAPGYGLSHFRLVFTTTRVIPSGDVSMCGRTQAGAAGFTDGVAVLKYYDGAVLTGQVRDSSGDPVTGAIVRVLDNYGIMHDQVTTGADGTYELLAPFSNEEDTSALSRTNASLVTRGVGPNTVQVELNGGIVDGETFSVSDAAAMSGARLAPIDFFIQLGNLEGVVFHDEDNDNEYDPVNETGIAGAVVSLRDRNTTTDAQGRYAFASILPGGRTLTVTAAGFADATQAATVPSGSTASVNVAMTPRPIPVSGVLTSDGEPVQGVAVDFDPEGDSTGNATRSAPASNDSGNYTLSLPPGTWMASVDHETSENGTRVRYFTEQPVRIEIARGDPPRTLDIALSREELPPLVTDPTP